MRFRARQIWPELRKARVAILGAVAAMSTLLQTMAGSLPPLFWVVRTRLEICEEEGDLQLEGHALQGLAAALHDFLSCRCRAREADLVDRGMCG
jgi:hypothetical protein